MDEQDFEIQISDLDGSDTEATSKHVSSVPLHSPRFSLKQRKLQVAATVGSVLLSIMLILGSYEPARITVTNILVHPSPTLAANIDLFYFDTNPSWGHLFIDGQLIPRLPPIGDSPLKLEHGRHIVVWHVDPFQPQRCVLSVPPQSGGNTCQIGPTIQTASQIEALLIIFSTSLRTLPQDQHGALVLAIQAALDAQKSTDIVQQGEVYAVALNEQHLATARQPLRATLHFQLDTNLTSQAFCTNNPEKPSNIEQTCVINQEDCRLLCSTAEVFQPAIAEWSVFGVVRFVWDYTTADGHYVAGNQPDAVESTVRDEHLIPMHITWDGERWHVITSFNDSTIAESVPTDPTCFPAQDDLEVYKTVVSALPRGVSINTEYFSESLHAAGCAVMITLQLKPASTPLSLEPVAYCLHRFGVFIAVNDVAHKYWPNMPQADIYEVQLTHQLLIAGA
jgi:hypothetical protein